MINKFWMTDAILIGTLSTANAQLTKAGALQVGAAKVDLTPTLNELPKQYLGVLDGPLPL